MKGKKIVFVSTTLGGGGAERVMSYIINYLSDKTSWEVILMLLKNSENNYISSLSSKVKIIRLNLTGRIRNHIIFIVIKLIKLKPYICFIGLDAFNKLFSPFLPLLHLFKIKVIARETNVLSARFKKNKILKIIYKYFYNNYDKIIAQSVDMRDDLIENWYIQRDKIALINNPVDINKITRQAEQEIKFYPLKDNFNFVFVGRLNYQKGLDILFQRINELKGIKAHFYIIGAGEEDINLKRFVKDKKLFNHITFLDYLSNPYPYIKRCDGMILSSRYEGFPNVLLEANALGKPIFSNDCKGGINEIINESNGVIVDFSNSLLFKEKLLGFIDTKFDSLKILDTVRNRYGMEVIMPKYLDLINSL